MYEHEEEDHSPKVNETSQSFVGCLFNIWLWPLKQIEQEKI